MERDRKSERNQQMVDQYKAERKGRREEMRRNGIQLRPAPRFAPGTIIPEIPEGMELHKFYGEPILLPAIEEGEPMFGRSRHSIRQAEILFKLEKERRGRERISLKHPGLF